MNQDRVSRLRRALVAVCMLAATWAAVVILTGGFIVFLYSLQVSSRNPRTPLLLALVSGGAAWALPMPGGRWRALREVWLRWSARAQSIGARWTWLRRADPAMMVALAGIGAAIYQWAHARPLWLDEEMIALNVRERSLADLAGPLWLGQSAPYGWLAAQRAFVLALGTSEHALRLVPVLFWIATLLVAVWVGRRWMSTLGATVWLLLCSLGRWLTHYPFEVKHYSADVFWGLLLPALAVWAIEPDASASRQRRAVLWWAAAAIGQWFANGALLATPACAVVLLAASWWRNGWRAALTFSVLGVAWLASFGLHFFLAVRHTVNSDFLRGYWSEGLPPSSIGLTATLTWLASRFQPIAINPGATEWWLLLWVTAAGGFVLSARPALGVVLASMPLSAFVLGGLGLVPLQDRLSIWIVPSLYLGVALFADSALRFGRGAHVHRSWTRGMVAVAIALAAFPVCADIFERGRIDLRIGRPFTRKQGLDDRSAVQWLMSQHRHGDVLITTRLALPALWWYGRIPLSTQDSPGGRLPDGSPILEVGYLEPGSDCQRHQLRDLLEGRRRVLVYSGFPDVPKGFDELLFGSLGELGVIRAHRRFADISRSAVVELRGPHDTGDAGITEVMADRTFDRALDRETVRIELAGCVVARPAGRWW
jgi:hypothetical protein